MSQAKEKKGVPGNPSKSESGEEKEGARRVVVSPTAGDDNAASGLPGVSSAGLCAEILKAARAAWPLVDTSADRASYSFLR